VDPATALITLTVSFKSPFPVLLWQSVQWSASAGRHRLHFLQRISFIDSFCSIDCRGQRRECYDTETTSTCIASSLQLWWVWR